MSRQSTTFSKPRETDQRGSYYSVSDYGDLDEHTSYNRNPNDDGEKNIHEVHHISTETSLKSIAHSDHKHHKFYRPTSNRTWVLTAFLLIIGICILLLELAIATHPDAKLVPKLGSRELSNRARDVDWLQGESYAAHVRLFPRQETVSNSVTTSVTSTIQSSVSTLPSTTSQGTQTKTDSTATTQTVTEAPNISSQVSITEKSTTSQQGLTLSPNPDNQVSLTSTSSEQGVIVSAPNPNSQVSLTTSEPIVASSPVPNSQVSLTTSGSTFAPSPVSNSQVSLTTSQPVVASSAIPNSQISITSDHQETSTSLSIVFSPTAGNQISITSANSNQGSESQTKSVYVPPSGSQLSIQDTTVAVITTARVATTLVDSAGVATATAERTLVSTALYTSPTVLIPAVSPTSLAASVVSGSLIVSGSSVVGTVDASNSAAAALGKVTLTDKDGKATATLSYTGNVVLTDANGKATQTISATGVKPASPTTAVDSNSSQAKDKSGTFTQFHYFLAMYLPNIIGVILQSAWLVVFATFKLMEPFYQLAKPGGASAQASLLSDYLSSGLSLSFTKAAFEGHWVMFLAGLVQLMLALVVMLVSEAMNVVPTAYCETTISKEQPCNPVWVIHLPIIRTVEVMLVGCFSIILMIIVLNRNRISGVYSDPSRIATMADVLVHKPLIQEIRDLPASATKSQIEHDLQDSRYLLGTFVANNGREQYGLIKLETDHTRGFVKENFLKSAYRRFNGSAEDMVENISRSLPLLPDTLCLISIIILFTVILVYRLLPGTGSNSFNNWMNSATIGPHIFLSSFAVCIGFLVKRKERSLRLSHPYVVLKKGSQPASETITAGTRATQFTAFYKGLHMGDISLALLSLAAIFSDVVLILVPGIPFSNAQTAPVYLASTYTCMGLLAIVFAVHIRVTFKEWRRGYVECPDTLAAVLMRLCASRFVEEKNMLAEDDSGLYPSLSAEFDDFNDLKQKERYEGVNGEKRYIFKCMEGVDGIQRYMVDEDAWARRR